MRVFVKILILVGFFQVVTLYPDNFLNFASQDSAITFASGVQFNVDTNARLTINGTLGIAGDRVKTLSGSPINFTQGYLRSADGKQVLLSATFDSSNDTCFLRGGVLLAQDGMTLKNVNVAGTGNIIAGLLDVTGSISLASRADVTVEIQNALSANILLNGGSLILAGDLILTPESSIVGPGLVDMQGHKLYVQFGNSASWASSLTFKNGNGIEVLGGSPGGDLPQGLFNPLGQKNGQSVVLSPGIYQVTNTQPMTIGANITLDGGSSTLNLMANVGPVGRAVSSLSEAQIRVAAGKSLVLKNIMLSNISANSFDLGVGATVAFGENVTLEFGSDAFWSRGLFTILNASNGKPNVVRMRGMNGRKLLVLSPLDINQTTLLSLGENSLALQDIELVGSRFISGGNSAGSLALAGNAVLNIEASTNLNIDVEDTGNVLALTQDALTLSGAFNFAGLSAENSLTVRFVLNSPIVDKVVTMVGPGGRLFDIPVKKGNPLVIFEGDPGILLTSSTTLAGMIFADPSVSIVNGLDANTNGFLVDKNAYLMAGDLEIIGHPIKQMSSQFSLEARSITGQGFDQGFIRYADTLQTIRKKELTRSAFSDHCGKRRACKPVARYVAPGGGNVTKRQVNAAIRRMQKLRKGVYLKNNSKKSLVRKKQYKNISNNNSVRVLDDCFVPTRTVTSTEVMHQLPQEGTVLYNHALVKNFESMPDVAFAITLQDGAQIEQKNETEFVIDQKHQISISGVDNRIEINGSASIDLSQLHFDNNASLTIACNKTGVLAPTILLSKSLELPEGAMLTFSGAGNVILQDQTQIVCNGTMGSRPLLAIRDGIHFSVAPRSVGYIGGIARIEVSNNACLSVDENAVLHIADSIDENRSVHDIDFDITKKSSLFIAMNGAGGLVRFAGGNASCVAFSVDNSVVAIGATGIFAFNVMPHSIYTPERGELRLFALHRAQLNIDGKLVFGPNRYDERFIDLKTQCDVVYSDVDGTGAVVTLLHNAVKQQTTSVNFQVSKAKVVAVNEGIIPEKLPRILGAR